MSGWTGKYREKNDPEELVVVPTYLGMYEGTQGSRSLLGLGNNRPDVSPLGCCRRVLCQGALSSWQRYLLLFIPLLPLCWDFLTDILGHGRRQWWLLHDDAVRFARNKCSCSHYWLSPLLLLLLAFQDCKHSVSIHRKFLDENIMAFRNAYRKWMVPEGYLPAMMIRQMEGVVLEDMFFKKSKLAANRWSWAQQRHWCHKAFDWLMTTSTLLHGFLVQR